MASDQVTNGMAQASLENRSTIASPNSYPALNPVDIYREHLSSIIGPIVGQEAAAVFPKLQWTQTLDKGDLALPVPALQIKSKKPLQLATEIGEKFPESDLVEKPIVNGTFIQFFFKPGPLTKHVLQSILKEKSAYGSNPNNGLRDPDDPSKGKKKIVVEFSSPNIAKPFHAGHLRSTIIGGFIAKLYETVGWNVYKTNYLGDWGKQYGLLANGYKEFGSEEELEKNPIGHLFDVYVKVNKVVTEQAVLIDEIKNEIKVKKDEAAELEKKLKPLVDASEDEKARKYFKSMEDGDEGALALWKRFRDLSITKYEQTYNRLNISFDEYAGESRVPADSIVAVSKELAATGVSENSDGAVIVDFEKHGAKKLGKAIFQRKDGTPLYLTRDIAEIRNRYEKHHFDKMIYVVAAQQDLHLAQFFKVTELSGHKDISDRCVHINFGMVRGMSTRKGTVKFLDDILRDVGEKMHEVMRKNQAKYEQVTDPEAVADTLGITAVMVQDMTGKRINGYDFNLDAMTSFEGDTGPYLQYAHARLCSIARRSELSQHEMSTLDQADFSLLKESHAIDLVRALSQWPDVVQDTVKKLEPATVLTYLFKMTHALSSSYDVLKVVGSEPELKKARMALYEAARQVLHNGMALLGLSPVERM